MKALIYTGHPAWKESLNPIIKSRWEQHINEIPEIESFRLYSVYHQSQKDIESQLKDEEILIGFNIDNYLDESFFERHPNLKYISTLAMGYGNFDRDAAKKHNVTLTNTVYGAQTIAQFTMALLLDICHDIRGNSDFIKKAPDNVLSGGTFFNPIDRQIELYGKTLGIIGLGHVGLWVARMAQGFGMKVIASSHHVKTGPEYASIEQVSTEEIYARADVISLNCSANPSTVNIINKESIGKMKDGVIIINPSRGSLIDEDALCEALKSGKVYAAGLDATSADNSHSHIPLMDYPNAIITPHIAWSPSEAQLRVVDVAMANVKAWINGHTESSII